VPGSIAVERVSRAPWRERRPLWALLALAAAIRFATLDQQSLWYDEAVTALRDLHASLGGTLSAVAHIENTPPLYYVALWLWTRLLGTGVLALRSLSALAGVATVLVGWAIGRQLGSRRAAIALAAILATNPLFVWYSQEARAYELFVLLAAVAFLFFLRAREQPSRGNLAGWAAASAAALTTHYFAAFLIAPEAVLLIVAWGPRRELVLALAAVAAAAAALAPLAISQGGHGTSWIEHWPLSGRLQAVGYYYLLGESGHPLGHLVEWAVLAPILATLALAVALGRRGEELRLAGPAAIVGIVAMLAPIVLAALGFDYLAPRYLLAAWLPLSAVLALAVVTLRPPLALAAGLVICLAFLAVDVAVVQRPQLQRGNWRWAAERLRERPAQRAVVVSALGGLPLRYYLPALRPGAGVPQLRVSEIDVIGYAALRAVVRHRPAPGFRAAARYANHGLVVVEFRASRPRVVSTARLFAVRPANVPSEVLASG
jgi:uncharacterized membrane protein